MLNIVQDTLAQTPADSLATAIGGSVGAFVALKLSMALSFVSKWVTEVVAKPVANWLMAKWGGLASWQKMVLAMIVGQAVAWANAWAAAHGLSPLPADLASMPTWAGGLVIGFMSMGWNAVKDALFKK